MREHQLYFSSCDADCTNEGRSQTLRFLNELLITLLRLDLGLALTANWKRSLCQMGSQVHYFIWHSSCLGYKNFKFMLTMHRSLEGMESL